MIGNRASGGGARLTVLAPGLFGPVAAAPAISPELDTLERLLGRADRVDTGTDGLTAALFRHLAPALAAEGRYPSAPFCVLADLPDADRNGYWLHADPVHLKADRDRLILFDQRFLAIGRTEADELVARFSDHFEGRGIALVAPRSDRWYLRLDDDPRIETQPLEQVVGRPIDAFMPRGADAMRWIALLNEVQMLFHVALVNEARAASGRARINGIWPWGGGSSPVPVEKSSYDLICADHPLAAGLASAQGIDHRGSSDTDAAIARCREGGRALVLIDGYSALAGAEPDGGARVVDLLRDIAGCAECIVDPCDGTAYRLGRLARYRFWRRRLRPRPDRDG